MLALVLAGCGGGGGGGTQSYRKEFEPLNRSLVTLGKQVGKGLQTAPRESDARLQREFGGYANRLGALKQRFAGLDPPSKLARDQKDLVKTVGRVESSLRGIETAARKHDFNAARNSTASLVLSSIGLRRARLRLAREVRKSG